MNPPLRFPDEFVRHKVLDLIGDLALLGKQILGNVVADRAGHAMHTALVSRILRDQPCGKKPRWKKIQRSSRPDPGSRPIRRVDVWRGTSRPPASSPGRAATPICKDKVQSQARRSDRQCPDPHATA